MNDMDDQGGLTCDRDSGPEITVPVAQSGRGVAEIVPEGKEADPASSSRERLAELIVTAKWSGAPLHRAAAQCEHCREARAAADAILAAGWRPWSPVPPLLPDSDQRGVWQSPDGTHLAVEAEDGELEWLECDAVGGWLLRGMLDMVPDEWVRLVPLPDSETEPDAMQWGYREHPDENVDPVREEYARFRAQDEYLKLVQREVRYGPWIEVTS